MRLSLILIFTLIYVLNAKIDLPLNIYEGMDHLGENLNVMWGDGSPVSEEDAALGRELFKYDYRFGRALEVKGWNYTANPHLQIAFGKYVVPEVDSYAMTTETPIVHRQFAYVYIIQYEVIACVNGWESLLDDSICPSPPDQQFTRTELAAVMAYATLYFSDREVFPLTKSLEINLEMFFGGYKRDNSTDYNTVAGFGNTIGKAIHDFSLKDGWNAQGIYSRSVNPQPFEDYTGYAPVNAPDELIYPLRWQPLMETDGRGFFYFQQHVTPQAPFVKLFGMTKEELMNMEIEWPYATDRNSKEIKEEDVDAIRRYTQEIFQISATLTEIQKAIVYRYDNKIRSLGFFPIELLVLVFSPEELAEDETIQILGEVGTIIALHDATVLAWKEKLRHDAVRPQSIIKKLFKDEQVTAYGGKGDPAATQIPAQEFVSYIRTMPHSEYPSGSSCACEAVIQYWREYFGKDELPSPLYQVYENSPINPLAANPNADGPYNKTIVMFRTLTDVSQLCGESRLWGGFHFRPAVEAGYKLCRDVGTKAY